MDTVSSATRPTLPPRQRAKIMMAMVERIARGTARRLPNHVQLDELIGAGALGLAEAYSRRRDMCGSEFEAFASCRIRGAILDQLRSWDPLSRERRRMARTVDAAAAAEDMRGSGEPATLDDVALRIGIDERSIRELRNARSLQAPRMVALPDLVASHDPSPEHQVCVRQRVTQLLAVAEKLPASQKLVVLECYVNDHSQREVADMLGVSESRVCQLRAKALRFIARQVSMNDAEKPHASSYRVPNGRLPIAA